MSSGNKVYKYRCSICQREVEQVSDNRRPDPLRCVITDQCRGILEPQGSRRGDRARLTTPQADLADRVARGSTFEINPAPADPVLIGMTTFGSFNGLTIAGPKRETFAGEAIYSVVATTGLPYELERRPDSTLYPTNSQIDMLVYELTAAVLSSQKYTYLFNSIAQLIEGVDDSKERRLMRFSETDNLTVIVNGVQLSPADYDRTENDTIRLVPGIVASEITIEVYVFKDRSQLIDEAKLIRLECKPLSETNEAELAFRADCAWGDVARLSTPDGESRSLLYCTDLSKLEERKTYGVARFEAQDDDGARIAIHPTQVWMLLSDAPHSFVDRRLDEVINGYDLVQQQFSFTYDLSEATGVQVPVASASALSLLATRLAPVAEARVSPVSTEGVERAYVKRAEAYIIGPA